MDLLEVSKQMEQEAQQYLAVARTGLDVAHKFGLLKNMFSWLRFRQQVQPVQQVDYREDALNALREKAVETYAGLNLTVGEAARILEPGFALDDLDKVNSTWQRHWTEGASKVGIDDEERRTWWARLLAGEIQQPETYSLRTLAVMDTLSTKEAKLFKKLCDYVWNPDNPVLMLPPDKSALWKPDFSQATMLQSISLAMFSGVADYNWGTSDEGAEDKIARQLPMRLIMTFKSDRYLIESSENKPMRLRCGKLYFTEIGQEMYRLTMPNYPQSYRDEMVDEWRQSYTVQQIAFARNS